MLIYHPFRVGQLVQSRSGEADYTITHLHTRLSDWCTVPTYYVSVEGFGTAQYPVDLFRPPA